MSTENGVKPYHTPSVELFGTITDLTAGGSIGATEPQPGSNKNKRP